MSRSIVQYRCRLCDTEHIAYGKLPNQCPGCRKKIHFSGGWFAVDILEIVPLNRISVEDRERVLQKRSEFRGSRKPSLPSLLDLIEG